MKILCCLSRIALSITEQLEFRKFSIISNYHLDYISTYFLEKQNIVRVEVYRGAVRHALFSILGIIYFGFILTIR